MKDEKSVIILIFILIAIISSSCLVNAAVHNITIVLDSAAPVVNLTSPANGTSYSGASYNVNFTFNVSDDSVIANCTVYANGVGYTNTTGVTRIASNYINATLSAGSYSAYVNCTDAGNNIGNSSNISITITAPSSGSSSSGGGGSGGSSLFWIKTYDLINNKSVNLTSGYSSELKERERIKIMVIGEEHYVGIIKIEVNSAVININSNPQNVTFNSGEEKKFDLNNDNYYDLSVKLNSILNQKASITIKNISEKVIQDITGKVINEGNRNETTGVEKKGLKINFYSIFIFLFIMIVAIAIIAILIMLILIFKRKKKR